MSIAIIMVPMAKIKTSDCCPGPTIISIENIPGLISIEFSERFMVQLQLCNWKHVQVAYILWTTSVILKRNFKTHKILNSQKKYGEYLIIKLDGMVSTIMLISNTYDISDQYFMLRLHKTESIFKLYRGREVPTWDWCLQLKNQRQQWLWKCKPLLWKCKLCWFCCKYTYET